MQPTGWKPLSISLWCVNTQAEVQMALTIHLRVEQSSGSEAENFIWLVTRVGGGAPEASGLAQLRDWGGAIAGGGFSSVEPPPSLGTQEALLTCAVSPQGTAAALQSWGCLLRQSIVRQCSKNQIYRALNMETWCELCKNVCGIQSVDSCYVLWQFSHNT